METQTKEEKKLTQEPRRQPLRSEDPVANFRMKQMPALGVGLEKTQGTPALSWWASSPLTPSSSPPSSTVAMEPLVRDVLFVLQGLDGSFVKFDGNSGKYVVDPRANISYANNQLLVRLSELGWLHKKILFLLNKRKTDPSPCLTGQVLPVSLPYAINHAPLQPLIFGRVLSPPSKTT